MERYSSYNRILLFPLGGLLAAVLVLALMLDPIKGDLARLGAYPESDFGWNAPQEKFERPLYILNKTGTLDQAHEIIIVGDSFSTHDFPFQWQNYFVTENGYVPLTILINKTDPDSLTQQAVFKQSPPRLVILEIAERSLVSELAPLGNNVTDCTANPTLPKPPFLTRRFPSNTMQYQRDTSTFPLRFGESAHTIKGTFKRWYDTGIKSHFGKLPQSVRLPLKRTGLFSSRVQDAILVYRNDFSKSTYDASLLKKMECGIIKWKKAIEKNGITRFVLMVAPDKTTAYEEFIEFGRLKNTNLIQRIADRFEIPRLDQKLKAAIREGTLDVYLPNDSHWGTAGHKLAAQELTRFLEDQGVLLPIRALHANREELP